MLRSDPWVWVCGSTLRAGAAGARVAAEGVQAGREGREGRAGRPGREWREGRVLAQAHPASGRARTCSLQTPICEMIPALL